MSLQGFADDSGSEPQSRFFVLGGFVADAKKWAAFSTEWVNALNQSSTLAYFKMSEAARLREQFDIKRGWTERKRDDRISDLVDIILKYADARVCSSLEYAHFERYIKTVPTPSRKIITDHPYIHLFTQLLVAVGTRSATLGITEPCDFIFDEQGAIGAAAANWWPNIKRFVRLSLRPGLVGLIGSPPIFRDEKQFLPLQAADMYAWQVRRYLTENKFVWMPMNRPLKRLQVLSSIDRHFSEAELIRLRDHLLDVGRELVKADPNLKLVPPKPKKPRRKGTP